MTNSISFLSVVMAVAELAGAAIFVMTKDSLQRAVLSCFGLGFVICIALADIIPDATENYPQGWLLLAIGLMVGIALMFKKSERGSSAANTASVIGMGLHNLCEGIVLATAGPMASTLMLAGAVAHKLPEGVVVFSLTERLSVVWRWAVTALFSLLIPIGTSLVLPENVQKPALALSVGILLVVLLKSLMLFVAIGHQRTAVLTRRTVSVAAAGGAVLAGLTCLVV